MNVVLWIYNACLLLELDTLSAEDGGLSPPGTTRLSALAEHSFKHGGILQHVRKDEESDLAASDEDIFQLSHSAISVCDCDVCHLAVHVVFSFHQLAPVHFASCCLAGDNVALRLVQNLDRDTDRHLCSIRLHVIYV